MDLSIPISLPIDLYCDNSATVLAATTLSSRKSRHLSNQASYVREHVLQKATMRVTLIGTKTNPADFFTKALPRDLFLRFRSVIMEGARFEPRLLGPLMTRK